MFRKIFFLILLILAFVFFVRARIFGFMLEPKIEGGLTGLFGMPIEIEALHADPVTGRVWAKAVRFRNPKDFSGRAHINLEGVRTQVDTKGLFHRKVVIARVDLKRLDYMIERRRFGDEPDNNAHRMVQSIRKFRKQRRERIEREEKEKQVSGEKQAQTEEEDWTVDINGIYFENGSFVYDDRTSLDANQFLFKNLKGSLKGFKYPEDPAVLPQEVTLSGNLGRLYPAPFHIEGRANFSNSIISFDLNGKVEEGPMKEYRRLWGGLPIRVRKGSFELFVHAVCRQDMLKAKHTVVLKSMKMKPEKGLNGKIWGMPAVVAIRFLQNQKKVTLEIPLEGDISDPKFDVARGFRAAFQESLKQRTLAGVGLLIEGPVKLATQTQELAVKASEKIVGGLEQVNPVRPLISSRSRQKKESSNIH